MKKFIAVFVILLMTFCFAHAKEKFYRDSDQPLYKNDIVEFDRVKTKIDKKNYKYGIADAKYNVILPVEYDYVRLVDNYGAIARKGDKYGYFSFKNKKLALPCQYENIACYYKTHKIWDVCTIKQDGLYKFFDINKETIGEKSFLSVENITEGKYAGNRLVSDNNGFYMYDYYKNKLEKLPYDFVDFYFRGYKHYRVKKANKWGLLDTDIKPITGIIYDEMTPPNLNKDSIYAYVVKKDNKYGYISFNGHELIPTKFKSIKKWIYDFYTVENFNNKKGIYAYDSTDGMIKIADNIYDEANQLFASEFAVKEDGKYGAIGFYGYSYKEIVTLIPFEYDNIKALRQDAFLVEKDGKQGLYVKDGEKSGIIVPVEYDNVEHVGWGLYKICKANKCGAYDEYAKRFTKLRYKDIVAVNNSKMKLITDKSKRTVSRYTPKQKINNFKEGFLMWLIWLGTPDN